MGDPFYDLDTIKSTAESISAAPSSSTSFLGPVSDKDYPVSSDRKKNNS